jgi:galactokinase
VVDTKGSHADLTPDYAAIPNEMKGVARFFGKEVLRELNRETLLGAVAELRAKLGDRAVLRALHFFAENQRVDAMEAALLQADATVDPREKQAAIARFLALVNDSGNSSWELLQNIYPPQRPEQQGISLGLALTRDFLEHTARGVAGFSNTALWGACRVQGGGFAGTIQAYIPFKLLDSYREKLEAVFGAGAVAVLNIRPVGAVELAF